MHCKTWIGAKEYKLVGYHQEECIVFSYSMYMHYKTNVLYCTISVLVCAVHVGTGVFAAQEYKHPIYSTFLYSVIL